MFFPRRGSCGTDDLFHLAVVPDTVWICRFRRDCACTASGSGTPEIPASRCFVSPTSRASLSQFPRHPLRALAHTSRTRSSDSSSAGRLITPSRVTSPWSGATLDVSGGGPRSCWPARKLCPRATLPAARSSTAACRLLGDARKMGSGPPSRCGGRAQRRGEPGHAHLLLMRRLHPRRPPARQVAKPRHEHQMPFQSSKLPNASPAGIVAFLRLRPGARESSTTCRSDGVALH